MNKAKINELYEKAHVIYEVPYHSSVVDPTIVSVHKQKVWDRYLFAELIVRECAKVSERTGALNEAYLEGEMIADAIKEHFGVK